MGLNCYEEGAVLKLSAYINIQKGDRRAAVNDLLSALNKGYIADKDRAQTFYNIAQIYLQEEDISKSLEYMTKWQPGRRQAGPDPKVAAGGPVPAGRQLQGSHQVGRRGQGR
jgi:hypothetical protein